MDVNKLLEQMLLARQNGQDPFWILDRAQITDKIYDLPEPDPNLGFCAGDASRVISRLGGADSAHQLAILSPVTIETKNGPHYYDLHHTVVETNSGRIVDLTHFQKVFPSLRHYLDESGIVIHDQLVRGELEKR